VNSSAGKDSRATLHVVAGAARDSGVLDRLVVVHADLGDAEWDCVPELAAEHAAHYGLRFEIARREHDGTIETILERVQQRGMWPDAARRWCTPRPQTWTDPKSDDPPRRRPACRRPPQPPARPPAQRDGIPRRGEPRAAAACPMPPTPSTSNGRRRVDDWYPIHDWTFARVWERIATAGIRPHEAYAAGMSRPSCRFCVLSSRADLMCSARLNPDLADRYAEVERRIGHRFRTDLTMADVIAEAIDAEQLALIPLSDIA
jgi:3'-phosphoadenosine 5'-phosphosulfate sulfotransferase (PAPS reductase)/FAD synthetase